MSEASSKEESAHLPSTISSCTNINKRQSSEQSSFSGTNPPVSTCVEPLVASNKRQKNHEVATVSPSSVRDVAIHDICETVLGFQPGDRVEVLWDITPDDDDAPKETRWWGATLLPPDQPLRYHTFDLDEDSTSDRERVPLRVLDYDPYEEGGFPENSLNDTAFLSDKLLYDMGIRGTLIYRRAGSTWTPSDEDLTEAHACSSDTPPTTTPIECVSVTLDGTKASVLPILDSVLAKAIAQVQPRLSSLTAERQLYVAEEVSKAKERLADKLVEEMQSKGTREITPEIIKMCMEEVGKELAALKQKA